MTEPPLPLQAFSLQFDDFDQFIDAVVAWDLDFRQLSPQRASTALTLATSAELQLSLARIGCHCDQAGSALVGFHTFAVVAEGSSPFTWREQPVDRGSLLVFGSGGEFSSASLPAFAVHTIAIADTALAARPAGRRLLGATRPGQVAHCAPTAIDAIRLAVDDGLRALVNDRPAAQRARRMADLLDVLVALLDQAAVGGRHNDTRTSRAGRRAVASRARELVVANPAEVVSVAALAARVGTTERSLHRAFSEHFDLSPKRYLQAARLNAARRALRTAEADGATVAEVAGRFGFWHTSQFAADYRRLFGERPSETLRRTTD